MTLFGQGRAALAGDRLTADRLGWGERLRSRPDPEIVLEPADGDPRTEPWIAPPWVHADRGVEALRRRAGWRKRWTYLPSAPGVARYLERLTAPRPVGGWSVGLAGLGRVGGVAATVLAATPLARSGIRELLVHDVDAANLERWVLELGSVAPWRGTGGRTHVLAATPREMLERCDAVLFAASGPVPPIGTRGDVRMVQLEPNRAILRSFLAEAPESGYTGLFLVVSDPVEWLAHAAFHESNTDASGRFSGDGLAPERIAGLGLGVMWARALAEARREGVEEAVVRRGAAYGPHSTEVTVFDDVGAPDWGLSRQITAAARECNFRVRDLGHLPYVGPGASSVGLMLPPLLAGREVLASVLVGGIYFGAPARMAWGLHPMPRHMDGEVFHTIRELHERLQAQARALGFAWFPAGK